MKKDKKQSKREAFLSSMPQKEQGLFLQMQRLLPKGIDMSKLRARIFVPTIYYWEDKEEGLITAAFRWKGQNFGMSFPYDENFVRRNNFDRKKLLHRVRETLDVLVHHGKKILDKDGSINPQKVNDAEAERFRYDKLWPQKVAAFEKAVLVKNISKEQAVKLQLA